MVLGVKGITKRFKSQVAVRDLSFSLAEGEILALIGKSGAGKTTALRCVCGLETVDEGSIMIDGEALCTDGVYADPAQVRKVRQKVGMVFQNFNLFPHFSVMENIIESPVRVYGMDKKEAKKKAMEFLEKLDLAEKADAYPCELSGGQKQRVAIARACVLEPKVICFDEPTSALDPQLSEEIAKVIKDLAADRNLSVLIITHDMNFARSSSDRVIFMENGEAVEEGSTETLFSDVSNERIQKFMAK
jgi:polar amino acid transport system ATP-binding protein